MRETDTEKTIIEIYNKAALEIIQFIRRHDGDTTDALHVMEAQIKNLYVLTRFNNFRPSTEYTSFYIALCKYSWLAGQEKHGYKSNDIAKEKLRKAGGKSFAADLELFENFMNQHQAHLAAFKKLDERCQSILSRLVGGELPEQIAAEQHISVEYLQMKKAECMASVFKFLPVQTGNKRYSFRSIAAFAENAMEMRAQAAFDHAIAIDPLLRSDLEKYYAVRTSLRIQFAREIGMETIQDIMNRMHGKYLLQSRVITQKTRRLRWILTIIILVIAWLLIYSFL